jgi:hypothetical protein
MKFLVALAAIMAIAAGAAHAQAWLNTAREGNHPPAIFPPPGNYYPPDFRGGLFRLKDEETEMAAYRKMNFPIPSINFRIAEIADFVHSQDH